MTIPRRRGTGPKARLLEFLAAFDAWDNYRRNMGGQRQTVDNVLAEIDLCNVMIEARKQITGTLGL